MKTLFAFLTLSILTVSPSGFGKDSQKPKLDLTTVSNSATKPNQPDPKAGFSTIDMRQFKDIDTTINPAAKATVSCKTASGTLIKATDPGFESCTKQSQTDRSLNNRKVGPNETAVEFQFGENK